MACGLALKRSLDLDPLHSPEAPLKRSRLSLSRPTPYTASPHSSSSANAPASSPPPPSSGLFTGQAASLTPQQLQSYLRAEIKHLRRRKILPAAKASHPTAPRSPHRSGSSSEDDEADQAKAATAHQAKAAFSFSQVQQICQRLLDEQEERLRLRFEGILHAKLTEQYETFVKFTQDQIHRRPANEEPPSYLS